MSLKRETHLPYMPAIDGLRAVAVLAVFLFHVGVAWMPGGFLGVDVFFVISGYLITALLVSEFKRRGYIDVTAFWLRRARRLLPAVAVLIGVVMLIATVAAPADVTGLRGDAVFSLIYANNWHQIFTDQSYVEAFGRPSLFRHLWSLSVEEQFYLLWPLICAAGLTQLGRRGLLAVVIAGIIGSTALMGALHDPTVADGARAFFGTDTRAAALLVGVALALVWHPAELRWRESRRAGLVLDGLALLAFCLLLHELLTAHDYDPALYEGGGFLRVALWTAVLIAAFAHPASRIGWPLARPLLLWLGVRSYGFYLWHWPVIALTRPGVDVPVDGTPLILLQLAATLVLAELSYRFVEQPFRRRSGSPTAPDWLPRARPALALAVVLAVVVAGWSGIAASGGGTVASASAPGGGPTLIVRGGGSGQAHPSTATSPGLLGPPRGAVAAAEERAKRRAAAAAARGNVPVFAVGDSVMKASALALADEIGGKVVVNAEEGRAPVAFPGVIAAHGGSKGLPDDVVVQMGNNGPIYSDDVEALRSALDGVDHVYLVNVEVPRSWEGEVNDALEEAVKSWPQAQIVDWRDAIDDHLDRTYDGIHPDAEGAKIYAGLVLDALRQTGARPEPKHGGK
ncbi:MAG: acyltransferase [Solirubrobacterales bacterium]|nr:acyltransferase [Solirubrobacterales bacterium]MCB8970676.1 acyltransferase [Thermoleophilales bacterium]MCO5326466.1 acyltransferase [Solirubrobacterales bacterium]